MEGYAKKDVGIRCGWQMLGDTEFFAGEIYVICFTLIVSTITKRAASFIDFHRTILMILIGIISRFLYHPILKDSYLQKITYYPLEMVLLLQPPILYSVAYNTDINTLAATFKQCLVFTVFGYLISLTTTVIFGLYFFRFEWTLEEAALFSITLHMFEPLAVHRSVDNTEGSAKHIGTLLKAEALITSAVGYELFKIFRSSAMEHCWCWRYLWLFVIVCVCGIVFGIIVGKLSLLLMQWLHGDEINELCIFFAIPYISYGTAELLGISGPFSVITTGMTVSIDKTTFRQQFRDIVDKLSFAFTYVIDTYNFTSYGVIGSEFHFIYCYRNTTVIYDYFHSLALYFHLTISRIIAVILLGPILRRTGYGLTWKGGVALIWNSTRSTRCIGLAALLHKEKLFGVNYMDKVIFHATSIVALSTVINQSTLTVLLEIINFDEISPIRRISMQSAINHLQTDVQNLMLIHYLDNKLANANWKLVRKQTTIRNPYRTHKYHLDPTPYFRCIYETCKECGNENVIPPSSEVHDEIIQDLNHRAVKATENAVRQQFYNGYFTKAVTRKLVSLLQEAITEGTYLHFERVKNCMKVPSAYVVIGKCVDLYLEHVKNFTKIKPKMSLYEIAQDSGTEIPEPQMTKMQRIISDPAYEFCIHCYFVFSLIFYSGYLVAYNLYQGPSVIDEMAIFYNVEYVVQCLVLLLDVVLRATALGFTAYFTSCTNVTCFIVLITEGLTASLVLFAVSDLGRHKIPLIGITRYFLIFRLVIFIRFLLGCIKTLSDQLLRSVLHRNFDIAYCFLSAQEEILQKIDAMVNYPPLAAELKSKVCRNISLIQGEISSKELDYPLTAIAAKTRLATRVVLNSALEEMKKLDEEGALNEYDEKNIERIIQKRVREAPKAISNLESRMELADILRMVEWINGDEEVKYFLCLPEACTKVHPAGSFVYSKGSLPSGIHIITSGVVKATRNIAHHFSDNLPNTDCIVSFKDDTLKEQNLSVCDTLGLIGVLNEEEYVGSAVCITEVRTYYIPLESVREAIAKFNQPPSMEYNIWRFIATKVAFTILSSEGRWKGFLHDKLRQKLKTSQLPDLFQEHTYFLNAATQDVVLVQGRVLNRLTNKVYVAPGKIPSYMRMLYLPGEPEERARPILLILTVNGYTLPHEYDWRGSIETGDTSYCAFHLRKQVKREYGDNISRRTFSFSI